MKHRGDSTRVCAELGREITDEMVEAGARAHCPFAFEEGSEGEGRAEAIFALRKEVRAILTAALSVTRPDERCRYCDEAIEPGHDCSVPRPERSWDQGEHEGCGVDSERAVKIQRLREALSVIHEISQETNVPCWQAIQNIAATASTALARPDGGGA